MLDHRIDARSSYINAGCGLSQEGKIEVSHLRTKADRGEAPPQRKAGLPLARITGFISGCSI